MLGLCGLPMLRCHACGTRYAGLGRALLPMRDVEAAISRVQVAVSLAAGAALVLGAALWLGLLQDARVSAPRAGAGLSILAGD